MLRIGNCTVDITIVLQDKEIADILGIDNDTRTLDVAYDAIGWGEIEDDLKALAESLVRRQGEGVLAALTAAGLGEAADIDWDEDAYEDSVPEADEELWEEPDEDKGNGQFGDEPEIAEDSVIVRFALWEKGQPAWSSEVLDVDVHPALDEVPLAELPKWADEFDDASCDCGTELFRIGQRLGIVPEWDGNFSYDGIDGPAYEDYLDDRRRAEGLPHIERW